MWKWHIRTKPKKGKDTNEAWLENKVVMSTHIQKQKFYLKFLPSSFDN